MQKYNQDIHKQNLFKRKRVKALIKQVQKLKGKSMKDRMLLLFDLENKINEQSHYEENKQDKTLT